MTCYHVDNRSSEDRRPTEARASWPVYSGFSLGAGRSERRPLSDTSVVSRSPIWAYACFLTSIDRHFISMLWRHRRRTFRDVQLTVRKLVVVRAHDRISRVGDSDVSGDVRRSLLGRLADFRIPPHVELNTERANIYNRMN